MSKIAQNIAAANATFIAACEKLGVTYDSKCNKYRDTKGRFVSRLNLFPTETNEDINMDKIDYDNASIGHYDSIEDVLPPLPDWSTMGLNEITLKVCYHKRQNLNGIEALIPMKDENGQIIPVRKGSDGSEIGYTKNSKQTPEEMFTNRAAYWAEKLMEYGIDIQKLDSMLSSSLRAIGQDEDINEWANMYREDMIEKNQEKYMKINKDFNKWLVSVFGKELATRVKLSIRNEIDIVVSECSVRDEKTKKLAMEMDEIFYKVQQLSKSGEYTEAGNKRSWINFNHGPMSILASEVNGLGNGARMSTDAWKRAANYFSTYFWYSFQKMGSFDNAQSSKLYGIKQYAYAVLSLEKLSVMGERQGEVLGIDADPKLKTDWNDWFRKDNLNYIWNSTGRDNYEE